ncbi:MAG TPA: DNA methyltransferase [Propionibacteriaceae bacterium]|nr:DNA methyltransferase [Propionibacteriaceae bacterium]
MIKYLGSKRRLVGVLGGLLGAAEATTALDLFTGTTRVAQEFCRRGAFTTAVDTASYAEVFGQCYIETDAATVDLEALGEALRRLGELPGRDGYVTDVFCTQARYFHPDNGRRIDAIRAGIDDMFGDDPLRPLLLTSLVEAADRVDSTVGVQMAYLKKWAPRALRPLRLRAPVLIPGSGRALRADAATAVQTLPRVDLAYLDPPYNQHRYFTNYHVWETLVRGDDPEAYGVARKRIDAREPETKSVFNGRRTLPPALRQVIQDVDAEVVVVSFNDEGFVPLEDLVEFCRERGGDVAVLAFDTQRYIGSRIGIHNGLGEVVGTPGHRMNVEFLVLSGPPDRVAAMTAAVSE